MSYLKPKRISELATFDSDLDTPDKGKENSPIKNLYRLPKRVADLDLNESDSEDDKNDNLNCAILDESFVLSPSKDLDLGSTPCPKQHTSDENNKNISNGVNQGVSDSDSGQGTRESEHNIDLDHPPDDNQLKMSYRPIKARTQLFSSKSLALQEKSQEIAIPSVFQKKLESEYRTLIPADQPKQQLESKPEFNDIFATPSVRPQSFSITTAKTTAKRLAHFPPKPMTCEPKNKPQAKILFTTPIARPPPGSLLKSTPMDMQITSLLHRKLSPIKEPNEKIIKINGVDYVLHRKIGSGGSSSVYLGSRKDTGNEYAIKLVNLDGDQQVINGYLNETKLLAKLQGNINVVSLFDYCHVPEKSKLYMVMEKGESDLHKMLQSFRTHIPLFTLVSYWHQMLQAVNYIHQNGVIHSDLKPANFLMIAGRLKLIDFGIASNIAIDSTSIIKFSQAGTFNYISPEALIDTSTGDSPSTQHQPKIRISTKSDVWSLGCILYLLLYKKTPFSHIKVIHQKIQVLTNPHTVIDYPELPNFYPSILLEMVRKCLIYNPKERSSVADVLQYPFEMLIPIESTSN